MSERVARAVVVHGTVQGVFFRDSCRERAVAAGVCGWVANADDGTVRARLEGAPDDVEALLGWMREGPSQADVVRVDVHEVALEGLEGFEAR